MPTMMKATAMSACGYLATRIALGRLLQLDVKRSTRGPAYAGDGDFAQPKVGALTFRTKNHEEPRQPENPQRNVDSS